jgi:enoyl-CoA hydratase
MSDDQQYLRFELADSVATITLSRPEKLNAYTDEDTVALARLFDELRSDPRVRVVIFTGAGKAFSSGHLREELIETGWDEERRLDEFENGRNFFRSLLEFPKPVVVALNGVAVGVPLVLALCGGDIVIAERQARMLSPHVLTGLIPAANATVWPLYVGLLRAKRLLMLPDWISAEDALSIGLVTEVVDSGMSVDKAMEYALRLAALPVRSLQHTKRVLNAWLLGATADIYEQGRALEFLAMGTEDYRRAVQAVHAPPQGDGGA